MNQILANVVGSLGLYAAAFLVSMIVGDFLAKSERPVEQQLAQFRRSASLVFFGGIALRIWMPHYFNPALAVAVFLPNTGFGTMIYYIVSLVFFAILYLAAIQVPAYFFQRRVRGTTQSLRRNLAIAVPRFMLGVGQWVLLFIAFFSIQAFELGPLETAVAILGAVTVILSLGHVASRGSLRLLGKPIDEPRGEVERMVHGVAERAGVRVDRVFTLESEDVKLANAYAHGGRSNTVGLTTFLLSRLEPDEVEAVVAHELGHLKYRHTFIRYGISIVATTAALYAVDAVGSLMANPVGDYFLSLAAILLCVQVLPRVIYRRHEHEADAFAADLIGGGPLARALVKISRLNHSSRPQTNVRLPRSTHPGLRERLKRLVEPDELREILGEDQQ